MLTYANNVLCNYKKMQALVTRSDSSPYKDVDHTPSGTKYDDYIKWCLATIYKPGLDVGAKGNSETKVNHCRSINRLECRSCHGILLQ